MFNYKIYKIHRLIEMIGIMQLYKQIKHIQKECITYAGIIVVNFIKPF